MVPPLRALNAQWAIIAPRAPIYKISTPVQQGLLIPTQEWAAVMTVYPALQVPFLQATELLSSHFSVLCSSCSQRVMLPYFFKPFESQHFQSQPLVLPASVKTRLRNVPQTFFFQGFFCESPGQCDVSGPCAAGHFCLSGAVSPTPVDGGTGGRCPQGHYCPIGSSFPEPCPEGYYSNSSRNTQLPDCVPCPPGQYSYCS